MEIYKKGEGTLTRTLSFVAVLLLLIWGGKEFGKWLTSFDIFKKILVGGPEFLLPYYQQSVSLGVVVGIVLTVVSGFLIYRYMNGPRIGGLLVETEVEVKKVSWPTKDDAMQSTFIVLVFVIAMAVYLTGVEWILKRLFDLIWNIVN